MRCFPESAISQLEFDKVLLLLEKHARTAFALERIRNIRIHTVPDFIEKEVRQTNEYKSLIETGHSLPDGFTKNIQQDLKLLAIPGSMLHGEQWLAVLDMLEVVNGLFKWFDKDRRLAFPNLTNIINPYFYDKSIADTIRMIIDETGQVRDSASDELLRIRQNLWRKRAELRRMFERMLQKLNRLGYLADIEESFINGRRVLAVFAENKRQIKGVLHGESDTRQTAFIEPEETTELNNEIFSLEHEESREVSRVLRKLATDLRPFSPLLMSYLQMVGEFDFVRAKALLAIEMQACLPNLSKLPQLKLIKAYHPLLFLYHKQSGKTIVPMDISLNEDQRILVISGPNAGGKTVTMKTIGLNQLMWQAGLLVPVHPDSTLGVFKQLFIHIGDTQSLEFDLSTYSSHLQHMKYFLEMANGKTLFFIDELGSGSDPNLGGAFAEVILEELARKHSVGVVTTHYLNLKVLARRVPGIVNGSMQFDEENLLPLYKLVVGKPGSSYTFSIAKRIGLPQNLINRARKLVDENQYKLDQLLNSAEQDLQKLQKKSTELSSLIQENQKLKAEQEKTIAAEKHRQQVEISRLQNQKTESRIQELKDLERKMKSIIIDWRKAEDKQEAVKMIQAILFQQKENLVSKPKKNSPKEPVFDELGGEIVPGDMVKMKANRQIGRVTEIRGKKAIVQVGAIPIQVPIQNLIKVKPLDEPKPTPP